MEVSKSHELVTRKILPEGPNERRYTGRGAHTYCIYRPKEHLITPTEINLYLDFEISRPTGNRKNRKTTSADICMWSPTSNGT